MLCKDVVEEYAGCVFCVDCFYQFYGYTSHEGFGNDIFGFVSTHYGRLTGPFDEQVPGAHLSRFIFIPLILFFYKFNNSLSIKLFFIIYLISGFYIIWISGEAMAFATIIMGIVIYLILINKFRVIFSILGYNNIIKPTTIIINIGVLRFLKIPFLKTTHFY